MTIQIKSSHTRQITPRGDQSPAALGLSDLKKQSPEELRSLRREFAKHAKEQAVSGQTEKQLTELGFPNAKQLVQRQLALLNSGVGSAVGGFFEIESGRMLSATEVNLRMGWK
ncbi:MAG: hypothetical protein HYV07_33660 [Deltaproteobacteria bacterium]|nr:hypothetical protein [Deltaproteobacteria bacterium]